MAAIQSLQQRLTDSVSGYQQLSQDISKNHQHRVTLTQQQNENDMVKKELELLEEGATVYKLVGPLLVKQDMHEAKANVNKRLEYIENEMSRLDGGLKSLEGKQIEKQKEIQKIQQKVQSMQPQQSE